MAIKEKRFPDMENYFVRTRLTPDTFDSVTSTNMVCPFGGQQGYLITRTVNHKEMFSAMRDMMFASMCALYNHYFPDPSNNKPINATLKNYFTVCIMTDNDIENKVLSFDMYTLQDDSAESLIKNPVFKALPGVDDDKTHIAIFNFGYQYEINMNNVNALASVAHAKVFKELQDKITSFSFKNEYYGSLFDDVSIFANPTIRRYEVGLTVEPIVNALKEAKKDE